MHVQEVCEVAVARIMAREGGGGVLARARRIDGGYSSLKKQKIVEDELTVTGKLRINNVDI